MTAACVVDLDNLLHRGFDTRTGSARPQAVLDHLAFCAALQKEGVAQGTICKNREYTSMAEQLWAKLGFKVLAARTNCDAQVVEEARTYAGAGVTSLVLVGGDHHYCSVVNNLRARGVQVQVWARRANLSQRLEKAADSIRYIDQFLITTRAGQQPAGQAKQTNRFQHRSQQRVRAPQLGLRRSARSRYGEAR